MYFSFFDIVESVAVIYFLAAAFNPSFVQGVRASPPFLVKVIVKTGVSTLVGLAVGIMSQLFFVVTELPEFLFILTSCAYLALVPRQRCYLEDRLAVVHWRLVDMIMTRCATKSYYTSFGFVFTCKPHVTPSLMASIQPKAEEKVLITNIFNKLVLNQCDPNQKSIDLYF